MRCYSVILLSLASISSTFAGLPPRATPAAPPVTGTTPAKPLTGDAVDKLLAQLEEIDTSLKGKRSAYNASVLPKLKDAGANDDKAFALWLDAMRDQEYEVQGRTATEFSDFRNGKAKELRGDPSFTTQLRLQCQFLSLIILQADAVSDEARLELVQGASAYLDDFVASAKKLTGKTDELRNNAIDSVIGKHLKLDVSARKQGGSAAYIPGSISEIYQQMILPYYREKKAAANIGAAWTKRISQEAAMVELVKVPEQLEKFQKERLPELKWSQAKDLFETGQQEPAAAAMMTIIKANLAHRNAAAWIAELTSLAQESGTPAAVNLPGA
ncbi:MAG: hypothetical protein V4675_02355 [Verrucomicrobiota bacterium]